MTILHALFLGIIEGVTEFLPVSSTFHLLMATKLLGLPQTEFSKFFDVFIQAGAILAVFILFAKEWFTNLELLKKVVISFVPTAIVGFLLHSVIKNVFFSSFELMIGVFVVVGFLFLLLERRFAAKPESLAKTIADVTIAQAVIIGLAQSLAVMPGVSRAGAVIIGMMLMGYKREDAAKYSFTLAVPTILAAAALDLLKSKDALMQTGSSDLLLLLAGTAAAFISAFVVVRWFIGYLKTKTFSLFGWYRILAGAILFLLIR